MSATPGWTAEQEEPYYLVIKDASGHRIAEVFLDDAFPLYAEPNATARKQADLLAAAPEMYSALVSIREWLLSNGPVKDDGITHPLFVKANNAAHAAIAKATGQPPDLHDALESHLASVITPRAK